MKTLLAILLLSISMYGQDTYTAVNVLADPYASVKEKGIHFGVELERVEELWYAKTSFECFPKIQGGFAMLGASVGFSKQFGMFEQFRFYAAPKIQFIRRGGYTYPSYGAELGFDRTFDSGFIIGFRGTYDYRSDFEFWDGKSEFRPSVFIKVGFKI